MKNIYSQNHIQKMSQLNVDFFMAHSMLGFKKKL
jgi:hypothetical protein